jgi:hypothetical protein
MKMTEVYPMKGMSFLGKIKYLCGEMARERKRNEAVLKGLRKITIFRGSKKEYNDWKGYECEVVAGSYERPFFADSLTDQDFEMFNKGVEAIVNAKGIEDVGPDHVGSQYQEPVGLPVRKKDK